MYWVVVEGVGRRLEVLGRYPCGEWNDSRCCWFRGSVLGGGDGRFRWILARYRYLGIIGWGVSVELKPMMQARTHSLDDCPVSLSLRLML